MYAVEKQRLRKKEAEKNQIINQISKKLKVGHLPSYLPPCLNQFKPVI